MNKELELVIGISGRMRAGKSTVAKYLAETLNIPIVSFGAYLVNYAQGHHLQPTRDTLQDIGNSMIKQDVKDFVQRVFEFANLNTDSAIVEGIRHNSVIHALKGNALHLILIYIDVDQQTRYERYCSGQKISDDPITLNEFIQKDNHPVESEIESLKQYCDIVIGSDDKSNQYVIEQLHKRLPYLK